MVAEGEPFEELDKEGWWELAIAGCRELSRGRVVVDPGEGGRLEVRRCVGLRNPKVLVGA